MIPAFLRLLLMAETPLNLRLLLLPGALAPVTQALPVQSARLEAGHVQRRRRTTPAQAISTSSLRRIRISRTRAVKFNGFATNWLGQRLCAGWPTRLGATIRTQTRPRQVCLYPWCKMLKIMD